MESIKNKIWIIEGRINEINKFDINFLQDDSIIHDEAIRCINFSCSEGAFIHIISWLYVKYYDNKIGKENINFLLNYMGENNFQYVTDLRSHKKIVGRMRTFLHHDLKNDNKKNRTTKKYSNEWFRNQCFHELPESEDDWKKCLNTILDDSILFFNQMYLCLDFVFANEQKIFIIKQWEKTINPFSLYDVEIIIAELSEKECIEVDPHEYARKKYDEFIDDLKIRGLNGSKVELRNIIFKKMKSELL